MVLFIAMLVISVVASITFIILGIKTYHKKNKKIIAIDEYKRKNENRSMLISVIGGFFSVLATILTLFNSVPSPTIYPLNTEATVYNGTAKVDIKSYPIFTVYYSLDGSDPKDGNIYADSFTITETTTVAARNRFMHLFWSNPPSKSTFRFESVQNITANSVDNSTDEHTTIQDFFSNVIIVLFLLIILVLAIRGELDK